ncbi:MAG TPA: SDR family oxidoreductase [Gemmatimonadales bacterium]|nr:SDR family oxidoreductase [Gemmatimonadales bacterium]
MTTPLSGRTILVTGASRGIGAAIAGQLAGAGATVARIARSAMDPLDGARDFGADLTDAGQRSAAFDAIERELGLPHAVVSAAGAFMLAPLEETSDALLREQLQINLEVPYAVARHFLPRMRRRGSGRHVLIGSIADLHALPENSAYSASKFGARGVHEVLLEEYRGSGVHCTLVSPGPTDTTIWDPVDPDSREGFIPRGRMLRPQDVADAVAWILSLPAHVHVESLRLGPG